MNPCTSVYTVYFDTLTPERQELFKNHCYVDAGFHPQSVQRSPETSNICAALDSMGVPSRLTLYGWVEYEFLIHSREGLNG